MRFRTFPVLFLLICFGANCLAVPVEDGEVSGDGSVSWAEGFVYAKGMGLPPRNAVGEARRKVYARLSAKASAQRQLLEITKGVRIDAKTLVVNMMVANSEVNSEVTGYLGQFAEIVKDSEKWNGEYYELLMRIPFKGLYRIIYEPEKDKFLAPEAVKWEPAGEQSIKKSPTKTPVCTGIVIDCRGLKFTACVRFQIVSKDKKHVYGVKNALFRVAADKGLVGYSTSLDKAMKDKRVGKSPRLIKAVGIKNEVDVVVSSEDEEFIHTIAYTTDILAECKVIVVMD
jgi:hypothetical protein